MNKAGRIAASINSQASPFQLRACLFHCTPISERRKGTPWDPTSFLRGSPNPKTFSRRQRRLRKKTLLRNANEFTESLFQNWESDWDKHERPAGGRHPWYRPHFRDGPSRGKSGNRASKFRRPFEFCDDDDDGVHLDNLFSSMFGGNRSFYWSFTKDDFEPRFWSSSTYSSNFRTSTGRTYYSDEEYEEYNTSRDSRQYQRPLDGLRSDRLALGLSPSGPINIEDVKTAYRACALKWHPDRHQGSFKAIAEEKFKVCSAAYQSLCDKLL